MSQAEALLNSVSEEVTVHTHPVPDTDTYFIIDPITRQIENTNHKKNVIMQYDHNSERFTFELPRYIDGHDMLECTSVTVNVDNIETGVEEPRVNSDAPDMTDIRVHPDNSEKVISSWLISRNSTQLAGILSFHIEYKCVDSDGIVVYEWSTDAYDEIEIRARKKNGEAAVAEYSDVLEQWHTRIFGAGDSVMANIAAEGEAQVAAVKTESETQQEAVELKGVQTLDSIPEDYTEVDAMADEAVRSKGDAIVCEAAGGSIVLKDSSNDHIRGLKLFGKSTQTGDPTPDNPQEITSIENPTVSIYGTNLLTDYTGYKFTQRGITCEFEGDGVYHIYGTFSGDNPELQFAAIALNIPIDPNAKYTLSCELVDGVMPEDYHPYVGLSSDTINHHNWMTLNIDDKNKVGDIVNITRIPADAINNPTRINRFWIYAYNGTLESYTADFRIRVWLTKSDTPMPYEPYTRQKLTITNIIPGIPVTSGGNYTDENGQQWICDEIDLERGVYVQRVANLVVNETSDVRMNVAEDGKTNGYAYRYFLNLNNIMINSETIMCDRLIHKNVNTLVGNSPENVGIAVSPVYSCIYLNVNQHMTEDTVDACKAALANYPLTVNYVLATPIETPLTAEEIEAFKAIKTNYPNTTILNDAGAWMSVKYNADTKTYVENPKTLKLVDSSTGLVYELKIVDGNLTVVQV